MNEGFKKEDGPFLRGIEAALNKIARPTTQAHLWETMCTLR